MSRGVRAGEERHDPKHLLPMERAVHRAQIGISGDLPFAGVDVWNAYELSWLDPKGKPRVAIARFGFPADSPNLIESKSFKLYLNSFSQAPFESPVEVQRTLLKDLCTACGCGVAVQITLPGAFSNERISELEGDLIDDAEPDPGPLIPVINPHQTDSPD